MFAHQVIEDLERMNPKYQCTLESMSKLIRNAQKFHLGRIDNLHCNTGSVLNFKGLRLPYPVCWIDFFAGTDDNADEFERGHHVLIPKRGMIVSQNIKIVNSPIKICIFNCYGNDSIFHKRWVPNVFTYIIYSSECLNMEVGFAPHAANESKDSILQKMNKINHSEHSLVQTLLTFNDEALYESINKNMYNEILYGDSQDISTLSTFLNILTCKNIGTETVLAPDKLNRKRIKQGKQPLFSYHTLVIKPVGKRQESIPRHLWENRVHLQRGHFKTYTDEKPLFGHITGRFWWQPHVRGRNKDGVVMKDYEVRHEQK